MAADGVRGILRETTEYDTIYQHIYGSGIGRFKYSFSLLFPIAHMQFYIE